MAEQDRNKSQPFHSHGVIVVATEALELPPQVGQILLRHLLQFDIFLFQVLLPSSFISRVLFPSKHLIPPNQYLLPENPVCDSQYLEGFEKAGCKRGFGLGSWITSH